ncbi:MAG: tRNA (5-methylaminomethyl-2-thiouridine)(34)-methyltransferase MnmD [Flavobacteriales bacterium]|nr:tRNA (5-methylaminomethyl-2-thiouridine)(34)-methyltransferase MnmD [Flavobacteriales bacterium]
MKREIVKTADGSHTISVPELDEHYHSVNGAIAEAYHVYIEAGLKSVECEEVAILEIGLGTGLNAIITLIESEKLSKTIYYQGVEAYPVLKEEYELLNYVDQLDANPYVKEFELLHTSKWDERINITKTFALRKQNKSFLEIEDEDCFDLIYFDAFGPDVQPNLWTEEVFKKMYKALKVGGVLVTYSSKGIVKRALRSVGFTVKRLEGPKGKRHMLRAVKML